MIEMLRQRSFMLAAHCLLMIGSLSCSKPQAETKDTLIKEDAANLEEIVPKKLAASPAELLISEGESTQISVSGIYPYGKSSSITTGLVWSSSDRSLVEVNAEGKAYGKKSGSAHITVEKLGISVTINVEVRPAAVSQIIILPENPELSLKVNLGQVVPGIIPVEAYGLLSNGQLTKLAGSVTWESDDAEAVSWSEAQGLTAHKAGEWTIKASYGSLSKEKKLEVKVDPITVERIESLENPLILRFGEKKIVSLRAFMSDQSIVMNPSDVILTAIVPSQLRVLSGLQIEGIGTGHTQLKLTLRGKELLVPVYTKEAKVESITLEPESLILPLGASRSVLATAHFSDGRSADITSALLSVSSNPAVASVDGSYIESLTQGATTVTVSYMGASTQMLVNVGTPALARLEIIPSAFLLEAGRSASFQVIGKYSSGPDVDLTLNPGLSKQVLLSSVGEIIQPQTVKSKAKGKSKLSVSYIDQITNKTLTATAVLDVLNPVLESISFDPPLSSKAAGRFEDYKVKGRYSDGTEIDITNEANITIDSYSPGYSYAAVVSRTATRIRVTGRIVGVMKIVATMGAVSGSTEFTSLPKVLDSVKIVRGGTSTNPNFIDKGQLIDFIAEATFSDGSKSNITQGDAARSTVWYNSQPSFATLTPDGDVMHLQADYQGPASLTIVVSDSDPSIGTLSNTFDAGIYVPCSGSGKLKSYYCWYLGSEGESCDQTCGALLPVRAYDPATLTYAGSQGSIDSCRELVEQTFAPDIISIVDSSASVNFAIGCSIFTLSNLNKGIHGTTVPTNSSDGLADFRRVCACE